MIGLEGEMKRAYSSWPRVNTVFHCLDLGDTADCHTSGIDSYDANTPEANFESIKGDKPSQPISNILGDVNLAKEKDMVVSMILQGLNEYILVKVINKVCNSNIPDIIKKDLFHTTWLMLLSESDIELDPTDRIYVEKKCHKSFLKCLQLALDKGIIIRLGVWPIERYTSIELYPSICSKDSISDLISKIKYCEDTKNKGVSLEFVELFFTNEVRQAIRWGMLVVDDHKSELVTHDTSQKLLNLKSLSSSVDAKLMSDSSNGELVRDLLTQHLKDEDTDTIPVVEFARLIQEIANNRNIKPSMLINNAVNSGHIQRIKQENEGAALLYISKEFKKQNNDESSILNLIDKHGELDEDVSSKGKSILLSELGQVIKLSDAYQDTRPRTIIQNAVSQGLIMIRTIGN
jgi:hypothetical protein